MASDITITSLTAVGGLGQIAVTAMASSPAGMTCLAYMQPSSIDIYSSATDTWSSASKVGTINSAVGVFIHGGLSDNVTRYYWAVPRDADGNEGARYPATTAGVAATTKTAQPGPGSVGTTELANGAVTTAKIGDAQITTAKIGNAQITDAHITTMSAGKITAGTISASIEMTSATFTGGLFRTAVSGRRIEISGSNNRLTAYNSSGLVVAYINDVSVLPGVISSIGTEAAPRAAHFNSNTTAGADNPAVYISRSGSANAPGLDVTANGTGGNGHAIRAFNNNGGSAAIAVASASGGYGVLVTSGGYGPFTGAHDAFIAKALEVQIGDIVCDARVIARNGISDTVTEVVPADVACAPNVAGVVSARVPFEADSVIVALPPVIDGLITPIRRWLAARFDRLTINGVGEGQINVCGHNGDIAAGDYITTSTMHGKGQRQDDDIKRSCTVARAREAVSFSHPDQVKRVACFYECG